MKLLDRFRRKKPAVPAGDDPIDGAFKAFGVTNYGEYLGELYSGLTGAGGYSGLPFQFHSDYWQRLLDDLPGRQQEKQYDLLWMLCNSCPAAWRTINAIIQTISAIPLEAKRVTKGGRELVAPDHPVFGLFAGRLMSRTMQSLYEPLVEHLYFGGETFFHMDVARSTGTLRPLSFDIWSPRHYQGMIYKGVDEPAGFRGLMSRASYNALPHGYQIGYRFGGAVRWDYAPSVRNAHEYASFDQVVRVSRWNEHNPNCGLPLAYGAKEVLMSWFMGMRWNQNLSKNGGAPPGFWVPEHPPKEGVLRPEQVEAAQAHLDRQVQERQARNLALVLTGAFKFVRTQVSPREADFEKATKFNTIQIFMALGMPPTLAGYVEGIGLGGGSTIKETKALFLEACVLPFFDSILAQLNDSVMVRFGDDYRLCYDRDKIEALQPDLTDLFGRMSKALGGRPWLKQNEVRESTGFEPDHSDPKYDEIRDVVKREPGGTGKDIGEQEGDDKNE